MCRCPATGADLGCPGPAATGACRLEWRDVGPVVQGGRLVDIEGVPGEPYTFYVAYASGGVWKTTNNGISFEPLFDDQPSIIIGDMALDPSNPQRIFVGTGENNSSRSEQLVALLVRRRGGLPLG